MKCKICGTDHRGVAKHGGYCLDHQEQRAEAAEAGLDAQFETNVRLLQENIELSARAAQLETERKELIEWRDAGAVEIEKLTAERDEARKQLEQAQEDYERMKEERDNLRMSIVNNVSA